MEVVSHDGGRQRRVVITFNILRSLCDRVAKWSVAAESIWTPKYRRLSLVADRVSVRPPRSPAPTIAARLTGQSVKHIARTKTGTADRRSKNICPPHGRRPASPRLCARRRSNKAWLSCRLNIYSARDLRSRRRRRDGEHVRRPLDWTRLDAAECCRSRDVQTLKQAG